MKVNKMQDLRKAVRTPYAWPGGYPVYIVLSDGEALCHKCSRAEFRNMAEALRDNDDSGWRPVAAEVLWEDGGEYCAHCSDKLESAYGEPD